MYLIYNGVILDVVSFDGVDREVVYSDDETQVLYTRWTISVNALLNPKTLYGGGMSPVKADIATRQKLWTPRRKLFLLSPSAMTIPPVEPNFASIGPDQVGPPPSTPPSSDSALEAAARATEGSQIQEPYEVLLESPPAFVSRRTANNADNQINVNEASDARDGPTPLKLDITQIHGTGTFLVRYVIQTCVTPEPESQNIPSPVASHRWEMHFSATEDYYTIRTIHGKVIFRKDCLFVEDQGPDDWRAFLAHPIPVGYKRAAPTVNMSPDGTELIYEIQDVEQANNFNPWDTGATFIEVGESVAFSRGEGLLGINLNLGKIAENVGYFNRGISEIKNSPLGSARELFRMGTGY